MNIALLISYDGTHFSGWQIQKNGRTVQGTLEEALHRAFGIRVRVTGSGRTDAGVHAAGQVCNFPFGESVKIAPEKIADALNALLPADVKVLASAPVADSFDACRSAKKKTYHVSNEAVRNNSLFLFSNILFAGNSINGIDYSTSKAFAF